MKERKKERERWYTYVFANVPCILISLSWRTHFFWYTHTDKANPQHIEYIEKKNMKSEDYSSSINIQEKSFVPSDELLGESNRLT